MSVHTKFQSNPSSGLLTSNLNNCIGIEKQTLKEHNLQNYTISYDNKNNDIGIYIFKYNCISTQKCTLNIPDNW